jgi:hypothetical protein
MHASHVISPSEAHLDKLEDDTWTSHGLKGPRGHFLHPPRIHPRTHMSANKPKEGASRAHKGSTKPWAAEPTLAQLISPSMWCLLISPRVDSRGVWGALVPVLGPINRRGGGSLLSNSSCNPSLTFGSKARR